MTAVWDTIEVSVEWLNDIRNGRVFGLHGQEYRAVKVQSDSERLNGLESRIAKLENKVRKNG